MKPITSNSQNSKLSGILIIPSWLSGFLTMLIALALITLTLVSAHYQGSALQIQITNLQTQQSLKTAAQYNGVDNPTHGRLIEDLPLIVFWSLLGLIVYLFAVNIVSTIKQAAELRTSLNYVHADRHKALMAVAKKLALRIAVLAVWLPYIIIFFHRIVPFCINTALAAGSGFSPKTLGYGMEGVIVTALAVHLHVILFRLLLLKPRAFSNVIYT